MINWTNQEELENSPSITYDEVGVIYDDPLYNYNGQLLTNWNNQNKTI